MNDEELKKLWQQQPLRNPDLSAVQLISAMQNKTTLLRRCLDARDVRELVACAVVIIIFGCFYFTVYHEPISRLGDLIIIGSTIFIGWKIVQTRRTTPPAPPDPNLFRDKSQPIEARVTSLLSQMTLEEKIGQMTQPEQSALKDPADVEHFFVGSLLSGGDSDPKEGNSFDAWTNLYNRLQAHTANTRLRIPSPWGFTSRRIRRITP